MQVRNRPRLWLVAVGAAAVVAVVPVAASGGGGGGKIMLAERNMFTGPATQAGTFHLAGAYSDSGAATAVFTLTPLGDGLARLEGDHTLVGTLGTLVIHTNAIAHLDASPRAYVEGSWKVVSGTGAYAESNGGGSVRAVADFTNGTATIMREGAING
jgi:hypothetical protein